jgi:hypothetical protein
MIRKDESGWHLDKRVSVTHILTTLAMACALAAWMYALSDRVTVNTQDISKHVAVVDVQMEAFKKADREAAFERIRQYNDIIRRLERIEDSLKAHEKGGE